jgi:choline dehydrogenase-like flavoprotein
VTGCIYAAKQSLLLNYLPQAVAAGATIETDLEALRIVPLPGHRYEVRCRGGGREAIAYRTRILVLGGGTIGTARLLLASRDGMPFLGGQVGRHIAFNGSVKAAAVLADDLPDGDMFTGRTHPGMISYEFLESHGITVSAAKAMPLQLLAGVRLRLHGEQRQPDWWGAANVELMRLCRRRLVALYSMGLTPPGAYLSLGPDGAPMLHLDVSPALAAYHKRTEELLHSILLRNGCRLVDVEYVDRGGAPREALGFSSAHQVGSCRMADSKDRGVVNPAGEAFDYPGLYISDGSAIPSSLAVNTSLTILANAERIAAGIVRLR